MSQDKAQLIYVGDPMCSWCYGIAEELETTVAALGDQVDFSLVMGGLRAYNDQKMPELSDFLKHHWEEVSQMSGQKFNYGILASKDFVYDTEPPCRAVVVARSIAPEKELEFFKLTQEAFYSLNANTSEVETYVKICKKLGMDAVQFAGRFRSETFKALVKKDFMQAGKLGVNSFPTIILVQGNKAEVIARGYATSEDMLAKIMGLL